MDPDGYHLTCSWMENFTVPNGFSLDTIFCVVNRGLEKLATAQVWGLVVFFDKGYFLHRVGNIGVGRGKRQSQCLLGSIIRVAERRRKLSRRNLQLIVALGFRSERWC